TIFTKKVKPTDDVKFEHLDNNFLDSNEKWTEFIPGDEWRTLNTVDKEIIYNLESNFETKIGDLAIQNGVATQRNNIYSFNALNEDDKYYYFTYKGTEEKIESGITRPFVLPNTQTEYTNLRIIFPYIYDKDTRKSTSITEEEFSSKFPFAYAYLNKHKEELDSRKHDKNMPNWFSYGRSQGINQYGKRLYLPYMANKVKTRISNSADEVFAAGYAIFDDSTEYLLRLAKILESDMFSYYLKMVSKPYSNNYYSTAKNMIKYFSLPSKDELLSIPISCMTENYVEELYGITKTQQEWISRILAI
ncbi:SAM-dependent DNA methyltransferase, partial [Enterococcus faecalis]|nr:SAM-dependent DNA methyltransferase [Enterococcus faecalis]